MSGAVRFQIENPSSNTTSTPTRATGIAHTGSVDEELGALGGDGGVDGAGGNDGEGGSSGAPVSVINVKLVSITAAAPKR